MEAISNYNAKLVMLPLIVAAVSVATLFENKIPVPVGGHVCVLINGTVC